MHKTYRSQYTAIFVSSCTFIVDFFMSVMHVKLPVVSLFESTNMIHTFAHRLKFISWKTKKVD